MYPAQVTVDRTLPAESGVRDAIAKSDVDAFDGEERLERLHRVLYPAFLVEFRYDGDTGSALIDGLWRGNDESLAAYRAGAIDGPTVALDEYDLGTESSGLGRTVLLEFQAPNERARALLAERMDHVRSRLESENSFGDPATYLERLRTTFDLPAAVDPCSFEGVAGVERVFLPFWLAEFESDIAEGTALRTFRDTDEIAVGTENPHDWLADFVREDPSRLAAFGYEVQVSESDSAAAAADAPRRIRQPEGADLDAESLVVPAPDRGFGDVGGMADLKDRLRQRVLEPIHDPERYEEYGIGPTDGVLLYGPPGCGKTYLAGALAGELDRYFIEVGPADLTSKYMGEPAQNVADLFAIARANQPCVLFVDELDALAGTRGGEMNASERQAVNQLLAELEDLDDEDVVVVGATNLLEDVDPAIRRSGRFDERVEVPPPDADARRAILRIHLAERPTAPDLCLDPAVERTAGFAASDLERIAEETARRALEDGSDITTDHLRAAARDVESSIDDWVGRYRVGDGHHVTQPEDADLSARSLVTPDPERDFGDVGGMDDLVDRLRRRVIDPLAEPETFAEYGIDPVSGVLLYGPPGCGKTYLAEALAGELGHYFLDVTPADLTSKWMGKPAQNVADLFAIARANQPCILFVDELDALAGRRDAGMNPSERQAVNQLLAELEAVAEDDVVVVGATNLVEDVDPAIRRSGRFDERIEVPPPDATARREILDVHLRERPTAATIDWEPVVDATAGHAASDLALIAESAARRALRADEPVDTDHLERAAAETDSSLADWTDADRYAAHEETSDLRYFG